MTYRKLLKLKFEEGFTTLDLQKKFPRNVERVNEIALLDIPMAILKDIIHEEAALSRLMRLKRRYSNFFLDQNS